MTEEKRNRYGLGNARRNVFFHIFLGMVAPLLAIFLGSISPFLGITVVFSFVAYFLWLLWKEFE